MPSVAPAGAVINVGESGVEVGFGLYRFVTPSVARSVSTSFTFTPSPRTLFGKKLQVVVCVEPHLFPANAPPHGNAQGDVHHIVSRAPAIRKARAVAGKQAKTAGLAGLAGGNTGVEP